MGELDNIISALRAVGARDFGAKIASKAEMTLRAALTSTLMAGASPEGAPWEARQKGGRAYAHAASRLTVKASGDLLRAMITGPEVYGHFGAHGMPVRQMLPDAGAEIPKSVTDAITTAAAQVFAEVTR